MRSQEIFDANEDRAEMRRARRQRLLRYGIPLASVVLMMAGLLGIAAYSYKTNRDDTLALSRDLLVVLEQQVRLEVAAHFNPADNAVRALAAASAATTFDPANRQILERFGMHLLRDAPMIALISVADTDGNYLMLRRNSVGGIDTKLMERNAGQLTTTWYRRDIDGKLIGTDLDPTDTYDPRTRPWYTGAVEAEDVTWTDAYIFFTDKKPGITASLATRDEDGNLAAIIGVDIFLDDLSTFLASLRMGGHGESMIVDERGRVIAQRSQSSPVKNSQDEVQLTDVADIERPYVTEAYDRIRVTGPSRSLAEIDRTRYIVLGSSLANIITRNWMLVFVVPESDFVGFVGQNARNSLYMSAGVVTLALILATLLIRQGLATDRKMRTMVLRERDMGRREKGFAELGSLAGESVGDAAQMPRFTEAMARATKASSVRVWRFEPDRSAALCLDSYDSESNSHTAGIEIARDQIPELFAAIEQGQEVVIDDVLKDDRLADVRRLYPANAHGRNLLLFPFLRDEAIAGYLALENVPFDESTADSTMLLLRGFARWLGTHLPDAEYAMASPARSGADSTIVRASQHLRLEVEPAALRSASLSDARQRLALGKLGDRRQAGTATIFPHVTSLTSRFDFSSALSSTDEGAQDLLHRIAEVARQACDRNAVRYLKIVGNEIFAADGFDGEPDTAAVNLANVAIELRDHCALLARRINRPPLLAMGLDSGAVLGTAVGPDGDSFNVWGESVQLSQALAATALPGSIQASQTTYDYLNSSFLFRRAGAYYLEQIGEMTTYTLRGRL